MDGEFIEKEMKEVEISFDLDIRSDGKRINKSTLSQPRKAAHDSSKRRSTVNCELRCLKTTN